MESSVGSNIMKLFYFLYIAASHIYIYTHCYLSYIYVWLEHVTFNFFVNWKMLENVVKHSEFVLYKSYLLLLLL